MIHVVQGHSATLSHTFLVDGVPTNPSPDSATVTITNDAGVALVTAGVATDAGTGVVTYTLTPVHTAELDVLSVAWTATVGGQSQVFTDVVEVAGGVLFTLAQARALQPLNNTTTYTTAMVVDARTMVETSLENACGVAFVPRYERRMFSGDGARSLMLPPRTRAIRSVTVDDVAVDAAGLATMRFLPTGELYYPSRWVSGIGNLEIAFEHGYDYPPPMATQAALTWAKDILVKGPISDRATAMTSDDGTFSILVPGLRGAISGLPFVDSFIAQYSMQVGVA
jgi:hypothetical protein